MVTTSIKTNNMNDNFYRHFEDRFRGTRSEIIERLKAYERFLTPILEISGEKPKALDFGCGRGEWLEYLTELGFDACGVDLDEGMLEACKAKNLKAEQGDLISYISNVQSDSVWIVSSFHVIEHIPFEMLQEFIEQAYRVLKPGGLVIFETPNAENLMVGTKQFYIDPSHNKPIPYELLAFLFEKSGFIKNKLLRLNASHVSEASKNCTILSIITGVGPDYGMIGIKNNNDMHPECLKNEFEKEGGASLIEACLSYDKYILDQLSRMYDLERRQSELLNKIHEIESKPLYKIESYLLKLRNYIRVKLLQKQ